jgi:signal transduction histidine kinase
MGGADRVKVLDIPVEELIERLATHRTLQSAPRSELRWLAEHGEVHAYEAGELVVRKGLKVEESGMGLSIVLSGVFSITVDRGAGPRKVMTWQGGDISGILPFSRMTVSPGDSFAEVYTDIVSIPPHHFPELIRQCPTVTEICVHVMLDRARVFNSTEWQDEKMVALGKLAAGLAHELNNPASAVARSAKLLAASMDEADRAARAVGVARLNEDQLGGVDMVRAACLNAAASLARSPIERADREDEIADWLVAHGADTSAATALAETAVTMEDLDDLASKINGDALDAALDWVAAGCAVRLLTAEIERASSRIYDLVAAIKGFTHLDRARIPEPTHLERGLRDTVMVLGSKARNKSVMVKIEVAPDLPRVRAIGSELNQVWANLIDNALDAVDTGGQVTIAASRVARSVVVRIVDNGPGIPEDIKARIYDPFFTTKEPGKGTGLGLEISRRIVRGHNGDIEIESKPGHTEFRVSLPVAEEAPQGNGSAAPATQTQSS